MGCFVVDNAMELSGISPGIRELHQSPETFFRRLAKNLSGDWKSLAFQSKRSTRSQTDTPPGGSSRVPTGRHCFFLTNPHGPIRCPHVQRPSPCLGWCSISRGFKIRHFVTNPPGADVPWGVLFSYAFVLSGLPGRRPSGL